MAVSTCSLSLVAVALLVAACSASPPPNLYLLSTPTPPPRQSATEASAGNITGYRSLQSDRTAKRQRSPLLGVEVTIPEYLDRPEIVVRTNANEITPVKNARWAENMSVTATRALAANLSIRVPSYDVIMLPSPSADAMVYVVNLHLDRFESDPEGNSVLVGRWSIQDRAGRERASGHVSRTEPAARPGSAAIPQTMSRNLAAASSDIAVALKKMRG